MQNSTVNGDMKGVEKIVYLIEMQILVNNGALKYQGLNIYQSFLPLSIGSRIQVIKCVKEVHTPHRLSDTRGNRPLID